MSSHFTSKLQADYVELINEYLDHIPIQSLDDFHVVEEALQSVVEPTGRHTVHPALVSRIRPITEIIDHPEQYVQQEDQYQVFRHLVILRVAAKIHELQQLSVSDKKRYISDQKQIRDVAMQTQHRLDHRRTEFNARLQSIFRTIQNGLLYVFEPHPEIPFPVPIGRAGMNW